MKSFVVFACLLAVAYAKPGYLGYTAILPGAPLGHDGRVVDTAEVSLAKAEHAAAHINEKLNLNREALRSADYLVAAPAALPVAAAPLTYAAAPAHLSYAAAPAHLSYAAAPAHLSYAAAPAPLAYAAAPALPLTYASHATVLAADGRPLDTPEVALAKASHAAAHINDKILHANEAARNYHY